VSLPTRAEFIHGPYDGLVIDVDRIEESLSEDALRESFDNRLPADARSPRLATDRGG